MYKKMKEIGVTGCSTDHQIDWLQKSTRKKATCSDIYEMIPEEFQSNGLGREIFAG